MIVHKMQVEGLAPGQQANGANCLKIIIPLINSLNKLADQTLNPSTNGSIVKCSYTLKTKSVMDGCTCCSSEPAVEVPIVILCPQSVSPVVLP